MTQGLVAQGLPRSTRVGVPFSVEVVVVGTPPPNAGMTFYVSTPGHVGEVPLLGHEDNEEVVGANQDSEMAAFIFSDTQFLAGASGKTWTFTFELWADLDEANEPGVEPIATLTHDMFVN